MADVEAFGWSEEKRLRGVDAVYQLKGEADRDLTIVVDEDRSHFENDDAATKYQRLALVDIDASETIDSSGKLVIADVLWQIIKPYGRDEQTQTWQIGNTVNKRKRHSEL